MRHLNQPYAEPILQFRSSLRKARQDQRCRLDNPIPLERVIHRLGIYLGNRSNYIKTRRAAGTISHSRARSPGVSHYLPTIPRSIACSQQPHRHPHAALLTSSQPTAYSYIHTCIPAPRNQQPTDWIDPYVWSTTLELTLAIAASHSRPECIIPPSQTALRVRPSIPRPSTQPRSTLVSLRLNFFFSYSRPFLRPFPSKSDIPFDVW